MLTLEEYLAWLKSATQQRAGATGDNATMVSAATMALEDTSAKVQPPPFWLPGGLFTDSGQTVQLDGEQVKVVEIPHDYLKMGNGTADQMQKTLEAELDYIEVSMSPMLAAPSTTADMAIKPFPIIQELKKILGSMVDPKIETCARSLDEFWNNWLNALTQLTDRTMTGAIKVLSSMSPVPFA